MPLLFNLALCHRTRTVVCRYRFYINISIYLSIYLLCLGVDSGIIVRHTSCLFLNVIYSSLITTMLLYV